MNETPRGRSCSSTNEIGTRQERQGFRTGPCFPIGRELFFRFAPCSIKSHVGLICLVSQRMRAITVQHQHAPFHFLIIPKKGNPPSCRRNLLSLHSSFRVWFCFDTQKIKRKMKRGKPFQLWRPARLSLGKAEPQFHP